MSVTDRAEETDEGLADDERLKRQARPHKRKKAPKSVLALPDLEQAKSAVLDLLVRSTVIVTCPPKRLAA
jgi:hypothetical protein